MRMISGMASWQHRHWLLRQALVWGVGLAVLRLVVVPAERCPAVDAPAVRRAVDAGATWLVRNQRPDGRFLYGYGTDRRATSAEYRT